MGGSILLFGAETWKMKTGHEQKMLSAENQESNRLIWNVNKYELQLDDHTVNNHKYQDESKRK